jgi:6-phosphofructokinase 1
MKAIGLLTSGGDAPGMNAAIRAVVLIARSRGCQVFGVERGYLGLVEGEFRELNPADVGNIIRDGGTLLGSARFPDFMKPDVRAQARAKMKQRGIEGLVVIGGNGSLAGASALADPEEVGGKDVRVVGVPASIDNDIGITRMSIGVDTAVNTIVEACDKIADTASAHHRAFLIEVMGRQCGYLAMASYVAVGADLVLFPESGKSPEALTESVVEALHQADKLKTRRVMVIVAEGVNIPIQELQSRVDKAIASVAKSKRSLRFETRVVVLGHVVRGGRPSAADRIVASRLGSAAVRGLLAGENRSMTAWLPPLDMVKAHARRSDNDPHCWYVDLDMVHDETKKLIAGTSPAVSWRARALDDASNALL